MHVLFIGDVVGEPGLRAIATVLPNLMRRHDIELVVANAENIADGNGVTRSSAIALFELGVDVLTNGNHAWDKKEALEYIKSEPRLLRPHNYPAGTPGSGWRVFTTKHNHKVGILNLLGNIFMPANIACPFTTASQALEQNPEEVKVIIVDIHAEVASEKIGMGWYLDGKVSAVVGTHTHVPTADERILPKGTGYITDVGMSGCYNSIVGMDTQKMLKRLIEKQAGSMPVATGEATLCAVMLNFDEITGRCREISRLCFDESDIDTGIDGLRLV